MKMTGPDTVLESRKHPGVDTGLRHPGGVVLPASPPSLALLPLAKPATPTDLPVPFGRVTTPRTIWSA